MEIVSSFYMLKDRLLVAIALISFLLSACAGLKTRDEVAAEEKSQPSQTSLQTTKPSPQPSPPETPPNPSVQIAPIPALPPSPPPAQAAPFLQMQKEAPRVGLILGAGGMKAFAHVGVLKEFARARIPIQSITGLEWGAAFAAIYAIQGQANEVEWKSERLRDSQLPERSFLSSTAKPQPIAILRDFLDTAFARGLLEKNRIEFACPAYSPKADKLLWFNKGSARDAIARCLAFPPFYVDAGGWIASPFAIEEAAAYLRAHGANFVIFVNPLAQGEVLAEGAQGDAYIEGVLWSEIKRHANRPQISGVNLTISINTSGYSLTDFEDRQKVIDLGSKAASETVNKLVNKYGF